MGYKTEEMTYKVNELEMTIEKNYTEVFVDLFYYRSMVKPNS